MEWNEMGWVDCERMDQNMVISFLVCLEVYKGKKYMILLVHTLSFICIFSR